MHWTGGNFHEITAFVPEDKLSEHSPLLTVYNDLEHHWMPATAGHWIIKGVKRDYYSCDPEVFEQTYEPAADPYSGLGSGH